VPLLFYFTLLEVMTMLIPNMYTFKQLLSETLREKQESYTIQLLFQRFQTVRDMLEASEEDFMQIYGIGKARARQIVSALQLARMLNMPQQDPVIIRSPKDIFDLMRYEIGHLQKEHYVVICLSPKNHIIGRETVFIGSLNASIVTVRELYKVAIKRASSSIIVVSNKTSQDCTPSREDIEIMNRLVRAGEIIGVELCDYLLVSLNTYTSMKESDLM
jgi:DNA repair protein RadC